MDKKLEEELKEITNENNELVFSQEEFSDFISYMGKKFTKKYWITTILSLIGGILVGFIIWGFK